MKNSSLDQVKTITEESCNTHDLYHSIKGIISKITNNIPYQPRKGRPKFSSTLNFCWSKFPSPMENFVR